MNKWLHGNGHWCPACKGTGRGKPYGGRVYYRGGGWQQLYDLCETCEGDRRLPGLNPAGAPRPSPTWFVDTIEYGHEDQLASVMEG
jgi:hypothetical protein